MGLFGGNQYRVSADPSPAGGRLRIGVAVVGLLIGAGLLVAHYGMPDLVATPPRREEKPVPTVTRRPTTQPAQYTPKEPPTVVQEPHLVAPKDDTNGPLQALQQHVSQMQADFARAREGMKPNDLNGGVPSPTVIPGATPQGPSAAARTRSAEDAARQRKEREREKLEWTSQRIDRQASDREEVGVVQKAIPYKSLSPNTLISCKTEAEVSNERPGAFRVTVTHDVLDSATHSVPVIPAGSTILARPSGPTVFGDSRLGIGIDTVTFPNGDWLPVAQATLGDRAGKAGLTGDIDRHYGSLLLATITRGALKAGTSVGMAYGADAGQRVASGVMNETTSEAVRQTQQFIRTEPTITIAPDEPCTIILEDALVLGGRTRNGAARVGGRPQRTGR